MDRQEPLEVVSLLDAPGLFTTFLRIPELQNYVLTLMKSAMISTNPASIPAIKNVILSDQDFNNLITDMVKNNPTLATRQKSFIDAHISLIAANHLTTFDKHVSSHQSIAPSIAHSVSDILPDISMADHNNQSHESQYDALVPKKHHGGLRERRAERRDKTVRTSPRNNATYLPRSLPTPLLPGRPAPTVVGTVKQCGIIQTTT